MLLDSGASLPGRDFALGYSIGFLLGPFRTSTFEVEGYAVRTNKPPFGPHRAPFAPQCAFAADSHMDSLAHRLGVDPIVFRLQHAWRENDRTPFGQLVTPFGLVACLERAYETMKRWRREKSRDEGLGIGVGFWSTNVGAGGEVRLKLAPDGLTIEQAERDIGSGSVTRGLSAVAERVTGLPAPAIRVQTLETAHAPYDSGVFGSRTVGALGQAVQKAALELLAKLGARLGTKDPAKLSFSRGRVLVRAGRKTLPLSKLLTTEERSKGGLVAEGRHYGTPGTMDESVILDGSFYSYADFTAAVHLAQAAVDRETGMVRVTRYAAFHDVGQVLDRAMFRGQVEGGVAMGLGEALTEETNFDPTGRLLNPTLLDYRIPTLGEVPPIDAIAVEGFLGAGPFGIKGLGEPPIIPVIAAVANAVYDATGARILESPLSGERVARALKLL
jgi:CO/xanthine dehydrogenase Mo-binding subunit